MKYLKYVTTALLLFAGCARFHDCNIKLNSNVASKVELTSNADYLDKRIEQFYQHENENIFHVYVLSEEELSYPVCVSKVVFIFSELEDKYSFTPDLYLTIFAYPDKNHGGLPYMRYRMRLGIGRTYHYISFEDLTLDGNKELILVTTGGAGSTRILRIISLDDLCLEVIYENSCIGDFRLANIDEDELWEILVIEWGKSKQDILDYYSVWDYNESSKEYREKQIPRNRVDDSKVRILKY